MLARNDVESYISDNYGSCDRGADCYHGRDKSGRFNGCLRTGWRGVACPHWRPIEDGSWRDKLRTALDPPP